MALCSARLILSKIPKRKPNHHGCPQRSLGTSAVLNAKRIVERQEDGVTVIKGEFVESPHAANLISSTKPGCSLCRLGIDRVTHDDVLILSQFMDSKGKMLPMEVTKLCLKQHRRVSSALYQAQRLGLIKTEEHAPRERWQELNNYFGKTRTRTDFGKPKIDIREFLRKPTMKPFWKA
ncbi:28S ribosomal protein S18a, mitochondrial [Galendromus occidentalis]|uniref:28S ribosomal protein S18a, mitochondrial n=1 Tax=Galendromus occidentalis TaxID=34638 RepID=A0AAJ6QXN4_9ACAR|nr:28S ribosomal protein S18a, mitochondrial [Galendromus occidentalis]